MRTIWKFPIQTTDEQLVALPPGAEMLCVQLQNGQPCLWALVDPISGILRKRKIRVVGTGHPCSGIRRSDYIGTYQLSSGQLVFHVFIEPEDAGVTA